MKYHLFAGYFGCENGMNAYRGAFDTVEDAYRAIDQSRYDHWAQLATIHEGKLILVSELEKREVTRSSAYRAIEIGWRNGLDFDAMETRYEKLEELPQKMIYDAGQVEDGIVDRRLHSPWRGSGKIASHQWIESDPF